MLEQDVLITLRNPTFDDDVIRVALALGVSIMVKAKKEK